MQAPIADRDGKKKDHNLQHLLSYKLTAPLPVICIIISFFNRDETFIQKFQGDFEKLAFKRRQVIVFFSKQSSALWFNVGDDASTGV